MSQFSYVQDNIDNSGSLYAQYPTPDNTQPLTNSSQSQPRTPGTLQSSQSNTTQIVDSFLSDIPQGSEYSTLDNSSLIPTIIQESSELAPHTPESILYSPALDVSLGDERIDLNLRKQQEQPPTIRRSPRISSNQTPQTSEQQSDSTSLKSQDSSNNRELMNKSPAALAFGVLDESTDVLSEHPRIEQGFSTSLVNTENRDINELRDLITTSSMILDSIHHSSVKYKNHEVDNEMEDIEYMQPHEVSRSELEREHENENEYPESVDFVIANETSDTLLRQSEHYNNMASKFSNLKFIKVEPESEEEIEQFTNPTTPVIRRSTRKRTTANYSYPRYSYGGSRRSKTRKRNRTTANYSYPRYSYGSSRRSKTRKRNRLLRKGTLSVTENEADVDSEVVNVDNEKNDETDELVHNLPVQSDEERETNEDSYDIQGVGGGENIDENIFDNDSQDNLYLKHDLRSRKIMLELPGVVDNSEETEKEPVAASLPKKITRSKQPAKKTVLKNTSKKSAKTISKRRTSRRANSRKKNEDREWHPDEADNELGGDSETATANSRGRRTISKPRLSSKASATPRKSKKVESVDVVPEVSTKKRLSSKKAPKISKTPKIKRKEKKLAQSNGGQGKGRGRITRSSGLRNHDTEYKYSGGEETESEIEITKSISEVVDIVDDNSIVQELSDAEIEQNIAVIEESVSTPTRPKRNRKSTKSSVNEPLISTPKSSRSTRGRDVNKRDSRKVANTQIDEDVISNIHEQSDKETADVPEIQADLTPLTQQKKTPRGTRSMGRGGKVKGRTARVDGNTATDQPIVPIPDPCIVEISAGNPTTLANAVRVLAEKNFDIIESPGNVTSIEDVHTPLFVRPHGPATRSTSLSGTPPPETQEMQAQSSWSSNHWHHLKKFYDETKSEYQRSGKVVTGNEDVYREVNKKFYDFDINNRTFGEEDLRKRIISLEKADEPSGGTQRRNSIESSSSRGSRSSISRYNKAYSNLRNGSKRKRSESNATTIPEGKKEDNNKEDGKAEDKVSKRHRVEGNTSSGSGTTPPTHNRDVPQTSPNSSILSRLFGGLFNSSQSQSFNEETSGELTNNTNENTNIMQDNVESPTRSRSWW